MRRALIALAALVLGCLATQGDAGASPIGSPVRSPIASPIPGGRAPAPSPPPAAGPPTYWWGLPTDPGISFVRRSGAGVRYNLGTQYTTTGTVVRTGVEFVVGPSSPAVAIWSQATGARVAGTDVTSPPILVAGRYYVDFPVPVTLAAGTYIVTVSEDAGTFTTADSTPVGLFPFSPEAGVTLDNANVGSVFDLYPSTSSAGFPPYPVWWY